MEYKYGSRDTTKLAVGAASRLPEVHKKWNHEGNETKGSGD